MSKGIDTEIKGISEKVLVIALGISYRSYGRSFYELANSAKQQTTTLQVSQHLNT